MSASDPPQTTIGANIRKMREARGLSQVQLADRLQMRQPSVFKIENGKGFPSSETLIKVAVALQCRVEDFLVGVAKDYAPQVVPTRHVRDGNVTTQLPARDDAKGVADDGSTGSSGKVIDLRLAIKRQIDDIERRAQDLHRVVEHLAEDVDKSGFFERPAVLSRAASTRARQSRKNRR